MNISVLPIIQMIGMPFMEDVSITVLSTSAMVDAIRMFSMHKLLGFDLKLTF